MAKNHPDFILLLTIAVLVIWGAFTMATVSFPFSLEKFGGSWQYAKHQMILVYCLGSFWVFSLL